MSENKACLNKQLVQPVENAPPKQLVCSQAQLKGDRKVLLRIPLSLSEQVDIKYSLLK